MEDRMAEEFEQKNADDGYEDICFICRRPESRAGKMFKMPGNMSICMDCMQKTMETVSSMDYQSMLNNPAFLGGFPGFMNPFSQNEEKETVKETSEESDFREISEEEKDHKDVVEKEEEPSKDEEKEDKGQPTGGRPFPNIRFINLADMQMDGMIPNKQKLKKRKKGDKPILDIKNIPPPHKIKAQLDEYVIGQEKAKKVISVAVYNHYKRVATGTMDEIEIEKSNMLMIGPTGSGKTYLVKTLAKLLDVPLAITDATSLTEAGYIGDDIESVVSKLLAAADNDVDKAEMGIIFIDEIDKIAKKKNTNQRDVSGESVQQGMLKLLEGAEIEVPVGASSKNAMVPMTMVNTKNILFICGGAFPGLEDIVKERLNKAASIGFKADLKDKYDNEENLLRQATVEDVRKFGMIPEFIGRLPILFSLDALTEDMLVSILTAPKNAIIKQYQKLLAMDEVKLEFEEAALHNIAKRAKEKKVGARALRAIIEEFMLDIMYEIPKDDNIGKVIITEDYIEKKGGPRIEMRGTLALEDSQA